MHRMGSHVWLDDSDVAALRKILQDDSFDEFAVSHEQLQQFVDIGKARMIESASQERIAGALFELAEQLQSLGIRI